MRYARFDHFLTYTSAENIDEYLANYTALGFLPEEKTVRHDPGLRNGFIFIGVEYIEFCWVEDQKLFAQADKVEKLLLEAARPFGIGMTAYDLQALHADWTGRGYAVPDIWSKAPRDASPDTPPLWSFQEIPAGLLPGVSCFVLTYHARNKDAPRQITIPPNTIYAITGVTFVTREPEQHAQRWRELLTPELAIERTNTQFVLQIGPHRAGWMTPSDFHASFGLEWVDSMHPFGEIAVLHLLASDLGEALNRITQAGRQARMIRRADMEELLILPDVHDGFVFCVQQYPAKSWLHDRKVKTGENLVLKPTD